MKCESEGMKRAFVKFEFSSCTPQEVVPGLIVLLHPFGHGFVIEFRLGLKVIVSACAIVNETDHRHSN